MKILLTIDGSDYNQTVVEELASRLFPSGTKIHIVSAFDVSPIVLSIPAPPGGGLGSYMKILNSLHKKQLRKQLKMLPNTCLIKLSINYYYCCN